MIRATVVIPNYNGRKYIKECFDALKRQTCKDFEVIFVDNASQDGSCELATGESCGLNFKLIELPVNYGFARAVNEGIKISKTEYVILLNNDTRAGKHFVEEMINAIDEHPGIFSAQALMLQYKDRKLVDSAGDYYSSIGYAFSNGQDRNASDYSKACRIFSSCAGAAIYRRSVFDKIGFFDENFFAYLEDVDIGYRANLYGYINVLAPKARVLHFGSGSSGSRHNEFKVSLSARNNIFLMYKNFAPWQMALNCVPVVCGMAAKAVYFANKGLLKPYMKGIVSGVTGYGKIKRVNLPNADYADIQRKLFRNTLKRFGG